jgi:hypothetical protein
VTWKTWAAAGAIPSMNYENTISFLTLVATICGLAFEYFGLKHRKAAPTPVTTKRRRRSAAALRAAKTHSLEALSRRPVSNPSTGGVLSLLRHAPASDRILNAPRILYINTVIGDGVLRPRVASLVHPSCRGARLRFRQHGHDSKINNSGLHALLHPARLLCRRLVQRWARNRRRQ